MKSFREKLESMGFRTRMRVGMVLVILLITILGMLVSTYLQNRSQVRFMNRYGKYIAVNLSQNSKLGILSKEPDNLKQPLNAAFDECQVMGVSVYLATGKLLGCKKRRQYCLSELEASRQLALVSSSAKPAVVVKTRTTAGQPLRSYLARVIIERPDDDIFNIEAKQGKFCGFVRVDMSLSDLAAKKAAILYQNLLLMPVYISIGMLFSILMERRISKPLMQLKAAAGAIAEGNFDTRIEVRSEDELGLLADSFNNMSGQLSATVEQLNYANEYLEKANEELRDFTYIVSHDLQEPLRKVHSFGQFLVEDYYESLPEEAKDYVERMQKASVKMKDLIQDLLEFSRIDTLQEPFTPVDTANVVNEALDDLSVAIQESQADIVVGQRLPAVSASRTQLVQLFENIVGNAIKYRSSKRKLRIEIGADQRGQEVVFSVKDNGIGIEERFFDKVFGVFQRLHNEGKYEGTGIGLALCKKIIQRHRGKIWLESTLDVGTTFYFTMKSSGAAVEVSENELEKSQTGPRIFD